MTRAFKGWRLRFCVKCNKDQPVRSRRRICIVCGETTEPKEGGGGYNAKKVIGPYSGEMRDSMMEAHREPLLQALANAGRITDLELKPGSYALDVYATGAVDQLLAIAKQLLAGEFTDGFEVAVRDVERSRQRIGGYSPDFQYRDATGALVVEDTKGHKISADFPLRKKLMVACHNVEVQVIREQRGVQQYARGAGAKGRGTGSRLVGGK